MNSAIKKTLLSSLVVPFALGVQTASAAQITEWGYDVDSSFSNAQGTDDGNGSVTTSGDNNSLTWGTDETSSVSITDVSSDGGLFTNGDAVNGGVFTHDNQVISANDTSLDSFDLNSSLTLTPVAPESGDPVGPLSLTFGSFFSETLNSGSCVSNSDSTCDDIFTISTEEQPAASGMDTDNGYQISQNINVDGSDYTVFLELEGVNTLAGDACAQAGAADGCVGLLTQEGNENSFNTNFRIASQEVPEPGTLALFGLGLVGLGLSRRKAAK